MTCDQVTSLRDSWLTSYPISRMPSCYKGIQSAVCKILTIDESCSDLSQAVIDKLHITFPVAEFGVIPLQVDWFPKLEELFKTVNSFLRMCWLKVLQVLGQLRVECPSQLSGLASLAV